MGQNVSTEQIAAHLERQEALVKQLQAVVDKQAQALERMGTTIDYDQDGAGMDLEPPTYLDDEIKAIDQRARGAERKRRHEDPIDDDERAAGNATWSEPTEEDERNFAATKPWLAAMAPPTGWEYGRTDAAPDVALQLEHVYGFRQHGVRNNVLWVDADTIVYFAAAVGVVHNLTTNKQLFFRGHSDEIISIAYHPARRIVATGDQGKFPSICVWSVDSAEQVAKCAGFHRRGVASLAFSKDGTRLASTGLDDEHSLAVYDWERGNLLAASKGDANRIFSVRFSEVKGADANNELITVGVKHVRFWRLNGATLTSEKALLGNIGTYQTFLAATSTNYFTVVGSQSGELYVFRGAKLVRVLDAHQRATYGVVGAGDFAFTAGRDGTVQKWNLNTMQRERIFDVNAAASPEVLRWGTNAVRSIDTLPGADALLVATISGTVSKISLGSGAIEHLVSAHHGDAKVETAYGELWGLCPAPREQKFLTAGEDGTLRLWSAAERRQVAKVVLNGRAQCVAWSPDGQHVAAGLQDGTVVVMNASLEEQLSTRRGPRRVQCLRFSPDSTLLAAGTADNVVNLFDVSAGFRLRGKLTGSNSVILHVDFSADGKYVQVATQGYELLHYEVATCQAVASSRALRDVQWASFSSILGWDVQGIWGKNTDFSDVDAVNRSNSGKFLAAGGDSGNVKLFRYPCVGGGLDKSGALVRRPENRTFLGHSEHVTEVQWAADDLRLFTAGGGDLCVFQWQVVAAKE